MPTYKNDTANVIVFDGVKWNPGEEKAVTFFAPYAELGLTKTSDEPTVTSPVLYCDVVTLEAGVPQTIEVPWGAERIYISAYAGAGESATIAIGAADAPAIPLDDTNGGYVTPEMGFEWKKASKITLASEAGATVHLLVEGV